MQSHFTEIITINILGYILSKCTLYEYFYMFVYVHMCVYTYNHSQRCIFFHLYSSLFSREQSTGLYSLVSKETASFVMLKIPGQE